MVTFILPAVLIPFRTDVIAFMVGHKRKISDLETLGKILSLIKGLDLEEGIHSIASAKRRKAAFVKTLTVSTIDISSAGKDPEGILVCHST